MGFIKDATKFDTGRTMKQYFDTAMGSVAQVKRNKEALINQIISMKKNGDFTEEDWKEVEELLNQLTNEIQSI